MRALVFSGDLWHPTPIVRAGLERLEDRGLRFDWVTHTDERVIARMFDYPVVILAKANHTSETDAAPWMTDEIERAFLAYVHQGHGLLVMHAGLAGYEQTPGLRGLVGGAFLQHPDPCPVTVNPKEDHPLTTGSTPFTVTDEHYVVAVDEVQVDIFMTTVSEHGIQPGGWTRETGQGRVCVLTPSHHREGWLHPSFQTLVLNALRWCGTC